MASDKAKQAVALRLEGKTYKEIGVKLGITCQYAELLVKDALGIGRKPKLRKSMLERAKYPWIANAIYANGESVLSFAKRIGVSPVTLSKTLSGKCDVKLSIARKISDALGATIDKAFTEKEEA